MPALTPDQQRSVEQWMPLVQKIARDIVHRTPSLDADDVAQDGVFGLVQALASFDPGRRVKFETYASWRIRGAILDACRTRDFVPRLARQRGQTGPRFSSLGAPLSDDSDATVAEILIDPDADPTRPAEQREAMANLIRSLRRRERLLLILRYVEGLSYREIGGALGVTESRISQLHQDLLVELRGRLT